MASAISTTSIDATFPVAGQDNDSQGFRDNFSQIKTQLDTASSEITTIQTNQAVTNATTNFNGHDIQNAILIDVGQKVVAKGTVSGSQTIDFSAGPIQTITTSGALTLAVNILKGFTMANDSKEEEKTAGGTITYESDDDPSLADAGVVDGPASYQPEAYGNPTEVVGTPADPTPGDAFNEAIYTKDTDEALDYAQGDMPNTPNVMGDIRQVTSQAEANDSDMRHPGDSTRGSFSAVDRSGLSTADVAALDNQRDMVFGKGFFVFDLLLFRLKNMLILEFRASIINFLYEIPWGSTLS